MRNRPLTGHMLATATLLALAAAMISGCGSSRTALGPAAARELHQQLSAVRTAAGNHDQQATLRALSDFSRRVDREAGAGHLTASQQQALHTGIARARARIELEVTPPVTQPAPAPPQTETPAPQQTVPDESKPPKGHKGNGHGNGHGKHGGKGEE